MTTSPTLDRIKADWMTARKARETDLAAFLGTVVAEASKKGRDQVPQRESTEAEVQGVLKSSLDALVATRDSFVQAGRAADPAFAKAESEIVALTAYRPEMMGEGEIEASLRDYMRTNPYGEDAPGTSMKSMKSMMRYLSDNHPGQYDGAMASAVAKRIITG